MSDPIEAASTDDEVVRILPASVKIRRAPKFGAFMVVGALLGVLVALGLTSLFPVDPKVGFLALFAYIALYCVTAGFVIGAFIAILLDRRSRKRAHEVEAEQTIVEPGPVTGELID